MNALSSIYFICSFKYFIALRSLARSHFHCYAEAVTASTRPPTRASAPAGILYKEFGITSEAAVEAAKSLM